MSGFGRHPNDLRPKPKAEDLIPADTAIAFGHGGEANAESEVKETPTVEVSKDADGNQVLTIHEPTAPEVSAEVKINL